MELMTILTAFLKIDNTSLEICHLSDFRVTKAREKVDFVR